MAWIETFSMIMRSNLSTLQEKFIDPEKMVHQLIIDMDEDLVRVRHSVSRAIADEILLRKRVDKASDDAAVWAKRARDAIARGDEASAKTAIERKLMAKEQSDRLERDHEQQKTQTENLKNSVKDLEEKIREAKQKQSLLLARLTRAESSRRINEALHHGTGRSALGHFKRLEERVDRAEALCEAYERLDGGDPDAVELERQFNERERKAKVEEELIALKLRLEESDDSGDRG